MLETTRSIDHLITKWLIVLLIYDINGRLISNFDSNIPTYINTASFTKGNYIINYSDINNNQYSKNISIY